MEARRIPDPSVGVRALSHLPCLRDAMGAYLVLTRVVASSNLAEGTMASKETGSSTRLSIE